MATVHANGTTLFHLVTGNGPPLVVVHGGLGVDHTQFRDDLDPLGDVLRLVYYDQRGNGRSGRPPLDTITHAQLVADLDALRAHLGVERWAVLGHSFGGTVALQYALAHPARLTHLFLAGTWAAFDSVDDVAAELARRATPPAVVRALMTLPADDAAARERMRTIAALELRDPTRQERLLARTVFDAAANRRSIEIGPMHDVRARLGEIAAPTLLLAGRFDPYSPPAEAERLAGGIRDATLVWFERSAHYPFAEEPARFRRVVREWLGARPRVAAPDGPC